MEERKRKENKFFNFFSFQFLSQIFTKQIEKLFICNNIYTVYYGIFKYYFLLGNIYVSIIKIN